MSTAVTQFVSTERIKLALFGLFGIVFLALSLPAFLEPMTFWTGIVLGDYAYPGHELHHLVLGSVLPLLLLGVIAQAYRPSVRFGALHTSIIIWIALTVVFAIGGEFSPIHLILLALLLGMVVFHPTGIGQRPSLEGLSQPMLVLAIVTAIGGFVFAGVELLTHLEATDDHVAFGHYLFMATAGLSIGALAVYGSIKETGWRFPIYGAGFLLVVIGAGSVLYPGAEQGSSLGVVLGMLVILWGIFLVVVAERGDMWFTDR